MKTSSSFLSRLLPARLRTRVPLVNAERRELFARVSEADPCLRAVLDLLQEGLEAEFHTVININLPAEQRLNACERMRTAWLALDTIETERLAAKAWREKEQAQKQ